MVALAPLKFLFFASIFAIPSCIVSANSILDQLIDEVDPCEEVCLKTYPSHTYEKRSSESCLRGCRFYSIIELVTCDSATANQTLDSCIDNCKEAYPKNEDGVKSCTLGCRSQKPTKEKWQAAGAGGMEAVLGGGEAGLLGLRGLMAPLFSMHSLTSSLLSQARNGVSVSWSMFMQDGQGRVVVVQSPPQGFDGVAPEQQARSDMSIPEEMKSFIDMSMGVQQEDPHRNSLAKAQRSLPGHDLSFASQQGERPTSAEACEVESNWLTCLAQRTGLPRLLLCLAILLSAAAMVWLCMSAAVTAPTQRIPVQKISINGDLEYLRQLMEKKGLKTVHPQDFVEARPLPTKIRIQQL